MTIADFLTPQDVRLDLKPRDKAQLLASLAEAASAATHVETAVILAALTRREELGSTGFGNGVALPHAAVSGLQSPFGLFVRLARPLAYDAVDGSPVDLVFLLLTPAGTRNSDLSALSAIARPLRSAELLAALRSARTDADLFAVLTGVNTSGG